MPGMDKPLVLVVDDERELANFIVDTVNESGKYEAVPAYSAKEAFAQLKKHRQLLGLAGNRIKLILLDIKMPETDGLQFLEKLRKGYNQGELGVLMVTAYEDEEKWDRATSGFIVGYLKKPVTKADLLARIGRFFSNPEARYKMSLDTFEEHIEKAAEFKRGKKE
jgi:CheY-like chemotaxis protein